MRPEAKVRARAGAIGFSSAMADTPTGQLSGGEKARLMLGLATFAGPHLVMLDEPTNHLDIDSRSALVAGINEFPGAVILVSHDRYLIEACADRLLLVANGEVMPFDGDLDDYRKWILASGRGNSAQADANGKEGAQKRPDRAEVRRSAAEKRQELAPLRKRIAEAEAAVDSSDQGDRAARFGSWPNPACSRATCQGGCIRQSALRSCRGTGAGGGGLAGGKRRG